MLLNFPDCFELKCVNVLPFCSKSCLSILSKETNKGKMREVG